MARQATGSGAMDRLVASYARETDIYQALLAIATEQGTLLEEGHDIDRCAHLFERKDRLLSSLARIEQEIEPLKRRWWTEELDPAVRQSFNLMLDHILETIEAIMAQEQRNEQLLLERQARIRHQLGHIEPNGAAHRADDVALPRFMDIRH